MKIEVSLLLVLFSLLVCVVESSLPKLEGVSSSSTTTTTSRQQEQRLLHLSGHQAGYYVRGNTPSYGRKLEGAGVLGLIGEVWNDNGGTTTSLGTDCVKQLQSGSSSSSATSKSGKISKSATSAGVGVSSSSSATSKSAKSGKRSKSGSRFHYFSSGKESASVDTLCDEEEVPVAEASLVIDPCEAIALETLISNSSSSTTFRIELGLVMEASSTGTIEHDLRKALQHKLSPSLTDCGSLHRRLQENWAKPKNVVFGEIQVATFHDCTDVSEENGEVSCLTTSGPVTVYGDQVSQEMEDLLARAPYEHGLGLPGLVGISSVSVYPSNDKPVPEGAGAAGGDLAANRSPTSNVTPDDGLSPGAIVGITMLLLVLALLAVFLVARRKRSARYTDEKFVDDETDYDADESHSISQSPPKENEEPVPEDESLIYVIHDTQGSMFGEVQRFRPHRAAQHSTIVDDPPLTLPFDEEEEDGYDERPWLSSRSGRKY